MKRLDLIESAIETIDVIVAIEDLQEEVLGAREAMMFASIVMKLVISLETAGSQDGKEKFDQMTVSVSSVVR